MRAGLTPEHSSARRPDYFHDMDYNLVNGKTAGVHAGGDRRPQHVDGVDRRQRSPLGPPRRQDSIGSFDLLKTISSHPRLGYGRHNRWAYLGLVNEPCFREAAGRIRTASACGSTCAIRSVRRIRLPMRRLSRRRRSAPAARPCESVPTTASRPGVVGLRLFPNPDFDEKARRRWNSDRFYNDPDVLLGSRSGPAVPGRDGVRVLPRRPESNQAARRSREPASWEDLSANVGAQYFWWDRVFNWAGDKNADSIFYQALHVSRPGTLDTSLVSTDNINNPRTMNAVYYLGPRMAQAKKWGKETIAGGGLNNKQFNDYVPPTDPLSQFFVTARHDVDAARAEGRRRFGGRAGCAESRLHQHRRVQRGVAAALPRAARRGADLADTDRDRRKELRLLAGDRDADAEHGALSARRHRSALPEGCAGRQRLSHRHRRHGRARQGRVCRALRAMPLEQAAAAARRPRSRERQRAALSRRVERLLGLDEDRSIQDADAGDWCSRTISSRATTSPPSCVCRSRCSASTPAARWRPMPSADNIWDNFSSESYKTLPSAGTIKIRHPVTGKEMDYPLPAGGRGYIRPASLVSVWSTAPFLQNNTVGPFEWSPSVEARMRSFEQSIEQMLWPERARRMRCSAPRRGQASA